jgi:hypothetical protein
VCDCALRDGVAASGDSYETGLGCGIVECVEGAFGCPVEVVVKAPEQLDQ